jgi:hypothetical protein
VAENVGIRDGQARTTLGVVALFVTGFLVAYAQASPWSLVLMGLALVLLASGTLRSCPLYGLFGYSTCK